MKQALQPCSLLMNDASVRASEPVTRCKLRHGQRENGGGAQMTHQASSWRNATSCVLPIATAAFAILRRPDSNRSSTQILLSAGDNQNFLSAKETNGHSVNSSASFGPCRLVIG